MTNLVTQKFEKAAIDEARVCVRHMEGARTLVELDREYYKGFYWLCSMKHTAKLLLIQDDDDEKELFKYEDHAEVVTKQINEIDAAHFIHWMRLVDEEVTRQDKEKIEQEKIERKLFLELQKENDKYIAEKLVKLEKKLRREIKKEYENKYCLQGL